MEITTLKPEYVDYVLGIIMKRWEVSKEEAQLEIDRWIVNKDESICFVGIIDDKPMATGVFETYSDVDTTIPCWNTLLWVEPEHRGKGYGEKMSETRFEYARRRGYKTIYLDTVNAKDYHLKTKFDWEIVREFDKNNEHYTIMKRDISDFKVYKRFPIQLAPQTIMLIHLFSDKGEALEHAFESMDMCEENDAAAQYSYKIHETAAKQFFDQLEGHYCDAFLEALIIETTRMLKDSDERRKEMGDKYESVMNKPRCVTFESRAQKALEKASKLISDDTKV